MGSETADAAGTATARPQSISSNVLAAGTHVLALPTWIVGPLLVSWLSRSEYVTEHARHAINWQLTVGVGYYLAGVLAVATAAGGDSLFVLWASVLAVIVLGGNLLFCGVAAVRAARGCQWEYPVAIRLMTSADVSRTF